MTFAYGMEDRADVNSYNRLAVTIHPTGRTVRQTRLGIRRCLIMPLAT